VNKNTDFIFISISLILMIKFDGKKLSLEECSKILNKEGNIYTKDEVKQCRDFIYNLVEIFNELEKE
jgi:hypothetical protein